jgi:hypothetical protein
MSILRPLGEADGRYNPISGSIVVMATMSPSQNLYDRVAETVRASECLRRTAEEVIVDAILAVRRSHRIRRNLNANRSPMPSCRSSGSRIDSRRTN